MEFPTSTEWSELHQALIQHLPPSLVSDLVLDDDHMVTPTPPNGVETGMSQNMTHQLAPTVGPVNSNGSDNRNMTRSPPVDLQSQPQRFSDKYHQALAARMRKGKRPMASISPEGSTASADPPTAHGTLLETHVSTLNVQEAGGNPPNNTRCHSKEGDVCATYLNSSPENYCVSSPNEVDITSYMSPEPCIDKDATTRGGLGKNHLPPRKRPLFREGRGKDLSQVMRDRPVLTDLPNNNELVGSPWRGEMISVELPPNFGISHLPRYDGEGDPREHIRNHILHVLLYTTDTRVYARIFPLGLEGKARFWFMHLKPGSVDCWEVLSTKFLEEFEERYELRMKEKTFQKVKQASDESILEYYDRFQNAARLLPDLNPQRFQSSFLGGLRDRTLIIYLRDDGIHDPVEFHARIATIIEIEERELREVRRKVLESRHEWVRGSPLEAMRNSAYNPGTISEGNIIIPLNKKRRPTRKREHPRRKYEGHRQMEKSLKGNLQIWDQYPKEARDNDQYCHYHRCWGHGDEQCRQLNPTKTPRQNCAGKRLPQKTPLPPDPYER